MTVEQSLRNELITAVFVDFENLALGAEEDKKGRFDIELVLKRLLERGRIVFKRAYCDWTRYQNFMTEFHKQGFEMVDIPRSITSVCSHARAAETYAERAMPSKSVTR